MALGACLTFELLSFPLGDRTADLSLSSRATGCLDTFFTSNEDGKILKMAASGGGSAGSEDLS